MAKLRISLANKCQLMFGGAVVLILAAALAVPWMRMQKLLDEGQREIAREIADAWLVDLVDSAGALRPVRGEVLALGEEYPRRLRLVLERQFEDAAAEDAFVAEALELFNGSQERDDLLVKSPLPDQPLRYRYARAVRQSDVERVAEEFAPQLPALEIADPLEGVVLIEMNAGWARAQILLNRIYIVLAGLLAGLLAIVVFWFITTRLILSPVRVLRSTADKVAEGDLNIRSDINTGDEYEALSNAFNQMLANLKASQDQLQQLNKQLDLKLDELAKTNISLFEANRLKNDFLANVSHELRTPLNSIVGFAEVLAEDEHLDDKRRRYVRHIIDSSRSLLTLINELLDLAKIEAGRIDLHVESMSVSDACEALAGLIRPQAEARKLQLTVNLARDLPVVKTDAGKFQQILFNFLSNAVKFTPEGERVELGAAPRVDTDGRPTGVKVWVTDTGPGIAMEHHEVIFEKFRQLDDDSHTKQYTGAGLGLAISKELARLLNATIELDSDLGRGATFSLLIPLNLEPKTEPLMPEAPVAS